nr:MAG TPA: hypothetical protein [Caudoviricetes sp.]
MIHHQNATVYENKYIRKMRQNVKNPVFLLI